MYGPLQPGGGVHFSTSPLATFAPDAFAQWPLSGQAVTTISPTSDPLPAYTGCQPRGQDTICISSTGEGEIVIVEVTGSGRDGENGKLLDEHCHFHAGVEHCIGGNGEGKSQRICSRADRDYNVPLRICMLFVVLATSAIGVFGPILLTSILPEKLNVVFIVLKQFGTGVIISTAFVHLFTHANLMFANECLGAPEYEGTAAAILMAGLFLSFLVDYAGQRLVRWHSAKKAADVEGISSPAGAVGATDLVNVTMLEAGILFHSLLIGLTLVVAGDSVFPTLATVIVFHQVFEGIALGTRIAALGTASAMSSHDGHHHSSPELESAASPLGGPKNAPTPYSVSTARKLLLASAFAFVTPIGMAVGIGVLDTFNGNSPATIVALGTLDALSAGILAWVGIVEMLAGDWMPGGELAGTGGVTAALAMAGLVAGMAMMSLLGKWA